MKIIIPKEMRGVAFSKIFTIELNDFDIDHLLPALFLKVLGAGRMRGGNKNDPGTIQTYVDKLAHHPDVEGFDDPEGRRVLERLVRTALITTGGVGRGGQHGEQIMSIVPYNLLAYKPGFPKESSRHRSADTFIYQALRRVEGEDVPLQKVFKQVFGKGIDLGTIPELDAHYDGATELDTLSRLSAAFVDGFKPVGVITTGKKGQVSPSPPPPCPELADQLARDLLIYLLKYYRCMPPQALTHYLLGLINLELFTYTIKTIYAINALVKQPENLPAAMRRPYEPSPPQLYLDFTGKPGSLSREMAAGCVRRDIEAYQHFMTSNLLLRQLDRYLSTLRNNPRRKQQIETAIPPDAKGAEYLQGLLLLYNHPSIDGLIQASATLEEEKIRDENAHDTSPERGEQSELQNEVLEFLNDVARSATTDVERVVAFLVEAQHQKVMGNYLGWYRDSGGLLKPHGLLEGNTKGRRSWRYAPRNDLLSVLVQLAVVRERGNNPGNTLHNGQHSIRLQDFLTFLEWRFGILVDRPPEPFHGADYAAAARENLRAMLRRLRQMGIFRDLSGDFTVQRLHPPYLNTEKPERGNA
jgi:hypothetical protein